MHRVIWICLLTSQLTTKEDNFEIFSVEMRFYTEIHQKFSAEIVNVRRKSSVTET